MPVSKQHQTKPGKVALITLLVLGTVLAWLVMTRSFVAWLATSSPDTALSIRSNEALALMKRAKRKFEPGKTQQSKNKTQKIDADQVRASVKKAFLNEPLNSTGFRILGQLAEKSGDKKQTKKFMQAAIKMSKRESTAAFWLLINAYKEKNFAAVLKYTDILLWHRPKLTKHITPILANIAEDKEAREILVALLAKKPIWRKPFFALLPQSMTDVRTPLNLFFGLKKTSAPPTELELRSYISFLNKNSLYDQSYYTWLQFLPPEQLAKTGFLFNGSFEIPPDRIPFNWTINPGVNVTTSMISRPDSPSKHALNIRMSNGRVDFGKVYQVVVLAPGHYRLEGRSKGQLQGQRGLRWRIRCLLSKGGRPMIAQGPMFIGEKREWRRFSTSFQVPDKDCAAQYIALVLDARTTSEKLVSGEVWYDDLKIRPSLDTSEK
ncbi:MAG: hypothetical protein L3J67_11095 [Hyphomicrobiaceae bacterium]|nr:hypothetical protein [Hyphomicrobiaceae bacterium]